MGRLRTKAQIEAYLREFDHTGEFRGYTILNTPEPFKLVASSGDIDAVMVYDVSNNSNIHKLISIFQRKGGRINNLEGINCGESIEVLGYNWFDIKDTSTGAITQGINILVER